MARVFILQTPRRDMDVSKALSYGKIDVLFFASPTGSPRPSIFRVGEFSRALLKRLREASYDPDVDYFCIVGSIVSMTISVAALVNAYKKIRVLLYNSTQESYVARIIGDIDETEDDSQADTYDEYWRS